MTITFLDDDVRADADPHDTILRASVAARIPHLRACGGQGRCTTCRVRVCDGLQHVSPRTSREARVAEERGWDPSVRLACQTRVTGDVQVRRLVRSAAEATLLQAEPFEAQPGREVEAVVLLCDIKQFTPFVDAHLPHDVFHILNRFFGALGDPILLNGGYIYQYVGDQVVALFGLDGASPAESALGAVRAGLGMIRALDALNARIMDEFGLRLGVRIGAHVGPLLVGSLGHPARRSFSVVGDAINVASRIEGTNEVLGTTFLVSDALHALLPASVETGFEGRVALKGKDGRHGLVEIVDFARPDPVLAVQQTARRLLEDADRFGRVFYRRLFEAAPETRRLFSHDLGPQAQMVTQMLQMAVYSLNRFDEVEAGLAAVGRSHVHYGVRPEHYRVFGTVFQATLAEILGPDYDAHVAAAWAGVVDRIVGAMAPAPAGEAVPC